MTGYKRDKDLEFDEALCVLHMSPLLRCHHYECHVYMETEFLHEFTMTYVLFIAYMTRNQGCPRNYLAVLRS